MGKRGFTLVELLIVIGICGLLLTLSFPAWLNFKSSLYLEASARSVASEMRKTQSLAWSGKANLIWEVSQLSLPMEISAQAVKSFKFSNTGFPLPGGTGTQVIENKFGNRRKIVLSSVGRVRIE